MCFCLARVIVIGTRDYLKVTELQYLTFLPIFVFSSRREDKIISGYLMPMSACITSK